jgi:hypothetical protein
LSAAKDNEAASIAAWPRTLGVDADRFMMAGMVVLEFRRRRWAAMADIEGWSTPGKVSGVLASD